MKNILKMFVLALTVLAFGGMSFAADKSTEKKSEKAAEKSKSEEKKEEKAAAKSKKSAKAEEKKGDEKKSK